MTAADVVSPDGASRGHPLGPGADLDVIREHLLPVEREQFDLEVRTAEEAGDTWEIVERWRTVAVIQADRAGFAAMVRRTAERLTGELTPEDEPLEVTRRRAGM